MTSLGSSFFYKDVCMSLPKDLANRLIDMALIVSKAELFRKGFFLF